MVVSASGACVSRLFTKSTPLIHGLRQVKLNELRKVKGKGKVHPTTGHEGPEGSRGIALLFL